MATPLLRIPSTAALCFLLGGSAPALDVIQIHSGNGAVGGLDSRVTMLPAPTPNTGFPSPFSAADFAAARAGASANIIPNDPSWLPASDVAAGVEYVSSAPIGVQGDSALFAIDFDVPASSWPFASLSLRYIVDNNLGDVHHAGINPQGVYLNGQPLAGFPLGHFAAVFTGCADVTTILQPGLNTLYLFLYDFGGPAGLAFEVTVEYTNIPPVGTAYCSPATQNSTGSPGIIGAYGSSILANDDLTLFARQLPAGEFGYFLVAQGTGTLTPPASMGPICLIGGDIGRYNAQGQVIAASACGDIQLAIDVQGLPMNPPVAPLPGETWNFQCWFRDGPSSNFTDALGVSFQ